jgi:hypothetical protein
MEIQNSFPATPLFSVARLGERAALAKPASRALALAFPRSSFPVVVYLPRTRSIACESSVHIITPCIVLVTWKILATHVVAEIDIPVGLCLVVSTPGANVVVNSGREHRKGGGGDQAPVACDVPASSAQAVVAACKFPSLSFSFLAPLLLHPLKVQCLHSLLSPRNEEEQATKPRRAGSLCIRVFVLEYYC